MTQKRIQGGGSDILGWRVLIFMAGVGGSNINLTYKSLCLSVF